MGVRVAIFMLFTLGFIPAMAGPSGDPVSDLEGYVRLFLKDDNTTAKDLDKLKGFSESLSKKRKKDEVVFLEYLFSKTHDRFLKQFHHSATFGETLSSGKYNCLTGVALYSILLNELGFDFKIIETNYHIFLLVETDDKQLILFETTDPVKGFSSDPDYIRKRINHYTTEKINPTAKGKKCYEFRTALYQEVSMSELRGLLYYNYAVEAYNRHDLATAINFLGKSLEFYKSSRTNEFYLLIYSKLQQSEPNSSIREQLLSNLNLAQARK